MLDKLMSMFKAKAVHRTAMVLNITSNVVNAFVQEFAEDTQGKDAALDAVIALLQQSKTPQ